MTRTRAAALTLISAAGWGQASTGPDEPLCERGDRAACHRLGLEARADGGTTRAWMWLGRACELGEPKACDVAAADANARGKWSQAEYFVEQARRWRANPMPQVEPAPAVPEPPRLPTRGRRSRSSRRRPTPSQSRRPPRSPPPDFPGCWL